MYGVNKAARSMNDAGCHFSWSEAHTQNLPGVRQNPVPGGWNRNEHVLRTKQVILDIRGIPEVSMSADGYCVFI